MASQLVDDVRALLRQRREEGRPLTDLERAFILSATAGRIPAAGDVIDELEAAIAETRRVCLTANTPPEVRRVIQRLLAAARGAIDYEPARPTDDDPPADPPPRPHRLDVDGYADRQELNP